MGNNDGKHYFGGTYYSTPELYAKGIADEHERSTRFRRESVRGLVDEIRGLVLAPGNVTVDRERSTPGFDRTFSRMMTRAVEHLVTDIDPTAAATPHGTVSVGQSAEFAEQIISRWASYVMPAERYATVIEVSGAMVGSPTLPIMAVPPVAGQQTGEKQPVPGTAFDIQPDPDSTFIDASYYLNVSGLIYDAGLGDWVTAIMSAAVLRETNRQIVEDIASKATVGPAGGIGTAFGAFDGGNYQPSVLVVPPSAIMDSNATLLASAGVTVVIDSSAPGSFITDPTGSAVVFKQMSMQQMEPSTYGIGVAFKVTGRVAVDPASVVAVTTP